MCSIIKIAIGEAVLTGHRAVEMPIQSMLQSGTAGQLVGGGRKPDDSNAELHVCHKKIDVLMVRPAASGCILALPWPACSSAVITELYYAGSYFW
jgi:hypothetical protein